MKDEFRQIWAAAGCVELLGHEQDRAEQALHEAITEALTAGMTLPEVGRAANMTTVEILQLIDESTGSIAAPPTP